MALGHTWGVSKTSLTLSSHFSSMFIPCKEPVGMLDRFWPSGPFSDISPDGTASSVIHGPAVTAYWTPKSTAGPVRAISSQEGFL